MNYYKAVRIQNNKKVSAMVTAKWMQLEYKEGIITFARDELLNLGYGVYICTSVEEARRQGGLRAEIWECIPHGLMPIPKTRSDYFYDLYLPDFQTFFHLYKSGKSFRTSETENIAMAKGITLTKMIKGSKW